VAAHRRPGGGRWRLGDGRRKEEGGRAGRAGWPMSQRGRGKGGGGLGQLGRILKRKEKRKINLEIDF
jgi:hypothetical protein